MPERRPATLDAEAAHAARAAGAAGGAGGAHAAGAGHVAPPPVEGVDAEAVRPLRGAVLRPGRPVSELFFEADDDPRTGHYAVRDAGTIVGVATVMPGGHPGDPRPGDWRIRGMAVEQDHRGGGIGSALLTACEAHARRGGGSRLWCNARIAAINLYLRSGMVIEGEQFDIPGIGMHLLMSRALD